MRTLFASFALVAFTVAPAMAGTLDFPKKGETMFKITIPDNWQPDTNDDDVVEASSPDENIKLSIWEVEASTKVETVANDLQDILKEYAKDVHLEGDVKQIDVDGLPGLFLVGQGVDPDDDRELGFIAFVLTRGEKAVIVFFEVDSNMSKDELKKFESILKSITVPSAE